MVITEIMYNPSATDTGDEFIELHNITGSAVMLQDVVSTEVSPGEFLDEIVPWKFSDGIDYTFDAFTVIPAYGYIIIAKNPVAFEAYHGVDALERRFENGTKLSDSGETIQIDRPADKEFGRDRFWVRVERVKYNDKEPWPIDADGGDDNGNTKSLSHKNPDTAGANYSNDVINWEASDPNPGE